jgi:hypothetical protein
MINLHGAPLRWLAAVMTTAVSTTVATAAQTFAIGESVEIEASGRWVPCVVTENNPEFIMRVRCKEVSDLSRAAGVYTVDRDNPRAVRKAGSTQPLTPAVTAPTRPAATSGLRNGEYACYGSGGRILAGFGFKVLPGGRYADLDGTSSGSYTVEADTVKFRRGHLDGTIGRALSKNNFRIGKQANCEPF